ITFNGTDIKNPMDFNMQIYFGKEDCENEDNIRKLADDPFIIHFMHEGEMPGPALVEIPETSLADGKYLLFYYVPEEMRAEFIDKVSAEGGATKFIIEHCSDYFIAKRAKAGSLLDTDDTKSDHGNNSVTEELTSFWEQHRWIAIGSIVVIVLAAGIIITATIVHKKQKRGPNKNPDVPS
ncbi:MAG: hypothetical protein U0M15_05235, partial [Bacillota bacterium]|nr:hypothetical protein [Bacillota bacterium]